MVKQKSLICKSLFLTFNSRDRAYQLIQGTEVTEPVAGFYPPPPVTTTPRICVVLHLRMCAGLTTLRPGGRETKLTQGKPFAQVYG